MQLGMVGLGRMGANLVRRLMSDGHECVVFDVNPEAVKALEQEGATGSASLDDFIAKLRKPRAAWVMVPASFAGDTVHELAARMEQGDTVVDGGNSYYRDDIDRAEALEPKGIHYVDVGTERRRLRSRARLLSDDRGRAGTSRASRPDLQDDRPWRGGCIPDARPRRRAVRPRAGAISTAGQPARATS